LLDNQTSPPPSCPGRARAVCRSGICHRPPFNPARIWSAGGGSKNLRLKRLVAVSRSETGSWRRWWA